MWWVGDYLCLDVPACPCCDGVPVTYTVTASGFGDGPAGREAADRAVFAACAAYLPAGSVTVLPPADGDVRVGVGGTATVTYRFAVGR